MAGQAVMRVRLLVALTLIIGAVSSVSSQTSTADGVAAMARGDYQQAIAILRPIAEDWRSQDVAAQFFVAGLYEHGHGVPADPLRACALYARAASNYESPFGRQASPLFAALLSRGQDFNDECQTLARVGFNNGFEPATFQLGPGHSVEWTLAAVTVTYDGRIRRAPTVYAEPGARFFPLKYTELATGPNRSTERHFVEAFVWVPTRASGEWNLQWHLFEVVRDEIIRIDTADPLVTLAASAPPSPETLDINEYAVVRVDQDGNAEWAVLKGSQARSERIETDVERHEAREARPRCRTQTRRLEQALGRASTTRDGLRGLRGVRLLSTSRIYGRSQRGHRRACQRPGPWAIGGNRDARSLQDFIEHLDRDVRLRRSSTAFQFLYRCHPAGRRLNRA
jgi:hypothetical protein